MRLAGIRTWLAWPSTVVAAALVLLGLAFIALEAQSPNRLYWTGDRVTGVVDGGIVYYRADNDRYTKDVTEGEIADGTHVDVYVNPDEPSEALLERPVKWIEGGAILACFLAALLLLVTAALRRRWRTSRRVLDPRVEASWRATG